MEPSEEPQISAERTAHVQRVLDRLISNSPIYTILLSNITLTSTSRGAVTTRLVLEPNHVNSRGTLHGAVSATIVDFTTGLAVASWDLRETTGASVDMHISYLGTAKIGETLEIEATANKVGGSMSFSTIRISKVAEDGSLTLVTLGQHTKYGKNPAAASAQAVKA
ncbi:HotDog domain-containing protein [Dactylonectria macrodidyma]|uniref:HotDog domain-containing protein n=1 Tax=Dactylonectria macrodidyma TaxID=307937 RepID=A0A9P9JGA3_9HYPO|nr:HotDog domain-containing protein [Dactylonectria macrodidyma]